MAVYPTLRHELPSRKPNAAAASTQPEPSRVFSVGAVLKLALLLVTIFAGGVTLLRVLTFGGSDLRALLTASQNCAAPCWNGIQPGVTTIDEAVAFLAADRTIADYQLTPGKLSWWWNGDQIAALDSSGRAFHGRMEYAIANGEDRISSIVLDTTIPLGDVQLTLGSPDSITLHTVRPQDASQRSGVIYVAHYDALAVFTLLDCPLSVDDFWRSSAYIAFGRPTLSFEGETFELHALPDWFFRDLVPGCATR